MCAFEIVLSQYRRTYRDRSSDLCMTIMALLTAGCDPYASSMWTIARYLWYDSVWDICDTAFRNSGWTTQEIDELVSSTKIQNTRPSWQELGYKAPTEYRVETSPREIIVQSIEEAEYERNMDPSRSDPGLSLDRASTFTPFKRPKIEKRQEDQVSPSPVTDLSSPPNARTPPDDPEQGNDHAHDLPEPFRNLDLDPDDIFTDEDDSLILAGHAHDHTPRYCWYCCCCGQFNSAALNPLCIGPDVRSELCEHRCCKNCSIDKVSLTIRTCQGFAMTDMRCIAQTRWFYYS